MPRTTGGSDASSRARPYHAVSRGSSTMRSYIRTLRCSHGAFATTSSNSLSAPRTHAGTCSTHAASSSAIRRAPANDGSIAGTSAPAPSNVGCHCTSARDEPALRPVAERTFAIEATVPAHDRYGERVLDDDEDYADEVDDDLQRTEGHAA